MVKEIFFSTGKMLPNTPVYLQGHLEDQIS